MKFVLALLIALGSCTGFVEEAYVTSDRPSVSNPAQLPMPGQVELELGGLASMSGMARRDAIVFLTC